MFKRSMISIAIFALPLSFTSLSTIAAPMYEFSADAVKMTAIEDGKTQLKFSFFENVPNEMVTTITSEYGNESDPGLTTSINTFLIQIPNKTILVDAGGGNCMGENAGHTVKALGELNIDPSSVTDILLTHAHTDHICGLTNPNSDTAVLTYPNATIHISEEEYQYWTTSESGESVKAIFDAYTKANPNSIARFNFGDEILGQFKAISTTGHTAGHIAYLWTPSLGNEWLFWGDVMHNAQMQFAHPEITIKFDTDKEMAKQTRLAIMNEAVSNKWRIAGAHLPYPGVGQITETSEGSYAWKALE